VASLGRRVGKTDMAIKVGGVRGKRGAATMSIPLLCRQIRWRVKSRKVEVEGDGRDRQKGKHNKVAAPKKTEVGKWVAEPPVNWGLSWGRHHPFFLGSQAYCKARTSDGSSIHRKEAKIARGVGQPLTFKGKTPQWRTAATLINIRTDTDLKTSNDVGQTEQLGTLKKIRLKHVIQIGK